MIFTRTKCQSFKSRWLILLHTFPWTLSITHQGNKKLMTHFMFRLISMLNKPNEPKIITLPWWLWSAAKSSNQRTGAMAGIRNGVKRQDLVMKPAVSACSHGQSSKWGGEDGGEKHTKRLADRELAATERPGFSGPVSQACWELAVGLEVKTGAALRSDHTQFTQLLYRPSAAALARAGRKWSLSGQWANEASRSWANKSPAAEVHVSSGVSIVKIGSTTADEKVVTN